MYSGVCVARSLVTSMCFCVARVGYVLLDLVFSYDPMCLVGYVLLDLMCAMCLVLLDL